MLSRHDPCKVWESQTGGATSQGGEKRLLGQRGVVACVDRPLGARGLLHDLTSGAMAVMCPASHEGVQVKLSHGVILPA